MSDHTFVCPVVARIEATVTVVVTLGDDPNENDRAVRRAVLARMFDAIVIDVPTWEALTHATESD